MLTACHSQANWTCRLPLRAWMLRTFSLAKKGKLICRYQHQSKPLLHRIGTLPLVIGTIRMI
jgi:hypothetical protein